LLSQAILGKLRWATEQFGCAILDAAVRYRIGSMSI